MKIHPMSILTVVLALSAAAVCQQPSAPSGRAAAPAQAPTILRMPPEFDERADAKAAIKAAVDSASMDGIRVLIAWGTGEDKGSKVFLDIRREPALLKPGFFSHEYKTVTVNVGRLDKNLELAKSYGAMLKADALPALTVLDSAGTVIANTDAAALRPASDPAGIDAAKVAAFLKSHQAPAPDAVAAFDAALKQARKESKTVFVWFSAPW